MRKTRIPLAVLALLALLAPGARAASDSATLAVTASVAAKCKLSLSGPMAFGALDTTSTSDATKTVTVTYQCTKGTVVTSFTVATLTSGSYTGAMTSGTSPDSIAYTIAWTDPPAFTGAGMGSTAAAQTVDLNGTILNADYLNVTPASYNQNVSIAVNY